MFLISSLIFFYSFFLTVFVSVSVFGLHTSSLADSLGRANFRSLFLPSKKGRSIKSANINRHSSIQSIASCDSSPIFGEDLFQLDGYRWPLKRTLPLYWFHILHSILIWSILLMISRRPITLFPAQKQKKKLKFNITDYNKSNRSHQFIIYQSNRLGKMTWTQKPWKEINGATNQQ